MENPIRDHASQKITKKALNLDPSTKDPSDTLKQILSGLKNLVSDLGGLSNKMADRHARLYKPSRHNAKLAINVAFTFFEFLLDSFEHQQKENRKADLVKVICRILVKKLINTFR